MKNRLLIASALLVLDLVVACVIVYLIGQPLIVFGAFIVLHLASVSGMFWRK